MTRKQLILLGAISFVLGLLLLAPAATLHGGFKPKQASYEAFGMQGTLTSGSLAGLSFGGRPALGKLNWQFQPWWLPLGRLAFHIDASGDMLVDGGVSFTPFGTVRLRNFVASGSIKPLLAAVGQAYLPVDGLARAELHGATLKGGLPTYVDGVIEAQNLAWTLARDPMPLGDYRADLSTESGDQLIKIKSVSGPLELSGNGKLAQDKSYTLELQLRLKPEASDMLRNLVAGAGQPDAQGYYHIRQQGKLAQ